MFTYTHVTRIGNGKDSSGKGLYKMVQTPEVSIPVTLDDIRAMLELPEFSREVNVTLNESGGDLKKTVKMPFICKLLANSIGLSVNAKARQGEGVDPLRVASTVLAGNDPDAKAEVIRIMASGDKKALRQWAETWMEAHDEE
jgi:hypothetical protein